MKALRDECRGPGVSMGEAGLPEITHESRELQSRFVSEHLRRIFLQIFRIVGNVDDAQDLTQETFIKALQRQGQVKDLEKSAHWLSRIASNTAIDFLRRRGRFAHQDIDDLVEPVATPRELNPEYLVLSAERGAYLEEGLQLLSDRERTALILRDVEDLPAEEVAKRMGCTKATVRSHIANARIKFRRYLEDRKS